MKTSDLTGLALRYAVAMAGDWNGSRTHTNPGVMVQVQGYRPDLLWEHGGPIIEREKVDCIADPNGKDVWMGRTYGPRGGVFLLYGPTPLVAAMRCFVASKLGDEIEIPKELM